MRKKEIMKNATIISAIIGVALSVILCIFLNSNIHRVLPVPQGTVLAYHESESVAENEVDAQSLKPNDTVGSIAVGKTKLGIIFESNYYNTVGAVSMKDCSSRLDEIGCAYFKTNSANAKLIKESKAIGVEGIYGSFKYELADELDFDSEIQATTYAPSYPKSIVVYYQYSNGVGLTSSYKALIYKGVE